MSETPRKFTKKELELARRNAADLKALDKKTVEIKKWEGGWLTILKKRDAEGKSHQNELRALFASARVSGSMDQQFWLAVPRELREALDRAEVAERAAVARLKEVEPFVGIRRLERKRLAAKTNDEIALEEADQRIEEAEKDAAEAKQVLADARAKVAIEQSRCKAARAAIEKEAETRG